MKLGRYGKNGFEKPGMIDAQGNIRDMNGVEVGTHIEAKKTQT